MAKAKQEEEKAKLPKNPNEYTYRGDEVLQIKASTFLALAKAIEISVSQGSKVTFPTVNKYIAAATGIDVENPAQKEIETGAVRPIMDVDKTFDQNNAKQEFEAWMVPDVVNAKHLLFEVHAENVKAGNAVHFSVIQEEQKAKQEQLQNKRMEEADKTTEEVLAPLDEAAAVEAVQESQDEAMDVAEVEDVNIEAAEAQDEAQGEQEDTSADVAVEQEDSKEEAAPVDTVADRGRE